LESSNVTSNVIDFGANRKPVYDFLLVINSNLYGPYLAPFLRYGNLLDKNYKFFPPFFHLASSFKFMEKSYGSWN